MGAMTARLLLVTAGLCLGALAGCGDPPPGNDNQIVYWLFPNGSDVNLKLSLDKPENPF